MQSSLTASATNLGVIRVKYKRNSRQATGEVSSHAQQRRSKLRPCVRAPQGKAPFGSASPAASRAAPGEALPNVCFVTGFTCEAGPEAIGSLHRQCEAIKSWLHAAYTSI